MAALRIAACPEGVDGERADAWAKLNHADIRPTSNAISTLLSSFGCGVKREDSAVITVYTANREARFRVLKIFVLAFVETLQSIDLAPRNFPRPKIALQCIDDLGKRGDRILLLISRHTLVPETEKRHRD